MTDKRNFVFAIAVFLAPVVVAWYGLSVAAAAGVVILLLLLRWLITLSGWVAPEKAPDVELETISASHFVEKVRWCMDLLGIDYVERTSGGTLGAYYRGRTVPQLRIRTGGVRSVIGNSPEILRFLYGQYVAHDPVRAAFLEPTKERLEFEQRLDAYGRSLQVWVYYHLLQDRDLSLHAWGVNNPKTPALHRLLLRVLFPLQARLIRFSFRINEANYARAVTRIEDLLADVNADLSDNRASLLGGNERNYTDYAFASFTGLWLMPDGYGGGNAEPNRIDREQAPSGMRADIERWTGAFPAAVNYVETLYTLRKEGL
ncbi:MAG: glutathione S-transferase domain-containing protein [Woeseiaceae bacterium]|nr:glutathione S-transferase domain-containing protein [Woeseiaceae bacterium]